VTGSPRRGRGQRALRSAAQHIRKDMPLVKFRKEKKRNRHACL